MVCLPRYRMGDLISWFSGLVVTIPSDLQVSDGPMEYLTHA